MDPPTREAHFFELALSFSSSLEREPQSAPAQGRAYYEGHRALGQQGGTVINYDVGYRSLAKGARCTLSREAGLSDDQPPCQLTKMPLYFLLQCSMQNKLLLLGNERTLNDEAQGYLPTQSRFGFRDCGRRA